MVPPFVDVPADEAPCNIGNPPAERSPSYDEVLAKCIEPFLHSIDRASSSSSSSSFERHSLLPYVSNI